MKWTGLAAFAALATCTSAEKLRKKVWFADTYRANSTELLQCVDQMRRDLEQNPLKNRIGGYKCGDRWWQYGNVHIDWDITIESSLAGFRMCEDDLVQAAYNATTWLQCKVRKGTNVVHRYVAYSPLDYEACFYMHAPCKPDSKEVYNG
ncbi:hypothetical protein CKM354_001276700 [Cercospora kikuchii]|uniref:Uncharacterized protein n=1 Tax=Cercospora kikuchii TaxID=84275 RepID=A0A9P3FMT0_9PEZI|nr:uncharacterized protein CKM354_001276700 [Cercospora kikuchii]GIZ49740.1 hypothetical protein CKM354_001276700 [Cercospora kikuchii]